MICPNCNHKNRPGRRFCSECGAPLERACPACGFVNSLEDRFCGGCGAELLPDGTAIPRSAAAPAAQREAPSHLTAPGHSSISDVLETEIVAVGKRMSSVLAKKVQAATAQGGGERRTVTVVLADLSGFTALSELKDPEEMKDLMNRCFDFLVDTLHKYEGYVDKFIGDCVMALFGAPIAHEDAPERACRAAMEMQSRLEAFNDEEASKDPDFHPLKLNIGINTGMVVAGQVGAETAGRFEYTVMGDTVNVASRLESFAEGGQIVISENVYERVRGSFDIKPLGEIRVKGKKEPLTAYEIVGAKRSEARIEGRVRSGTMARLQGRDAELNVLMNALQRLKNGEGQVLAIVGEAGAGKSRLVYELQNSEQAEDTPIYQGRCLSFGQSMPYLPFLDALRQFCHIDETDTEQAALEKLTAAVEAVGDNIGSVLPHIASLLSLSKEPVEIAGLPPQERQARTFSAVKQLLFGAAKHRPIILVMEDLHWSDEPSRRLLDYLVKDVSDVPIMLLCLYRPVFQHNWAEKPCYTEIQLERLSDTSSMELVKDLLGAERIPSHFQQLILEKTDGNPFFIEELIRSLRDVQAVWVEDGEVVIGPTLDKAVIPDTVEEIIMSRIDRLQGPTKTVVQEAAAIGRSFRYEVLERIHTGPNRLSWHLATLTTLGFIVGPEAGGASVAAAEEMEYHFEHAMIQEVAYNSLLLSRRRELHGRIGECLEELYPDRREEFLDLLAHHYYHSNNTEKALQYSVKAAAKAKQVYAADAAVLYCGRGLEILDRMEQTPERTKERVGLLCDLGDIYGLTGHFDEAAGYWREILQLGEETEDPTIEAIAHQGLAGVCWQQGEFDKAREYYRLALAVRRELSDLMGQSQSLLGIGVSYYQQGNYERAREAFEECLRIQEQAQGPYLGAVYNNLGDIYCRLGEYEKARQYLDESLRIARNGTGTKPPDKRMEAYSLGLLALADANMGNYVEALEHVGRCLALAEEIDEPTLQWEALRDKALYHANLGQFEDALTCGTRSLQVAEDFQIQTGIAEAKAALAEVYYMLGDCPRAQSLCKEALQLAESLGSRKVKAHALRILGSIYHALGDNEKAISTLKESLQIAGEIKLKQAEVSASAACLDALLQAGRTQEASQSAQETMQMALQMGNRRLEAVCYLIQADIEARRHNYQAALEKAERALGIAEKLNLHDIRWQSHAQVGQTLMAQGRGSDALVHLRRAADIIQSLADGIPDEQRRWAYLRDFHKRNLFEKLIQALEQTGDRKAAEHYRQMLLDSIRPNGSA